jgi:hypothetical protein
MRQTELDSTTVPKPSLKEVSPSITKAIHLDTGVDTPEGGNNLETLSPDGQTADVPIICSNEGGGTRTHDLGIKSPLLYQLSYAPDLPCARS